MRRQRERRATNNTIVNTLFFVVHLHTTPRILKSVEVIDLVSGTIVAPVEVATQHYNYMDNSERKASRILFASCNSQHYAPILWDAMAHRNASAFVWGGDAIYADDFHPKTSIFPLKARPREGTPKSLKTFYNGLLEDPGYKRFTSRDKSKKTDPITVLGAFDDHDYGINNGDRNYEFKYESAHLFLNFIKESSSSTVDLSTMEKRASDGKGVYGVKIFDFTRPSGEELLSDREAALEPELRLDGNITAAKLSDRSVAIILVDCRTHKTPWIKQFPDRFFADYSGDFLGDEQWIWLESVLAHSKATVNVIVQGLQVHADKYFDGNNAEEWSRYPLAQHRLYQAMLKSGAAAPVLVSGDVHMAELSRKDCTKPDSPDTRPRMILEVTVSGMTHSWGTSICARPHESAMCRIAWFQKALTAGMHLAHNNFAWTEIVDMKTHATENAKQGTQYSLEHNFGEFEFDWDKRQLLVRVFGKDIDTPPLLSTQWDLEVLSGIVPLPETMLLKSSDFNRTLKNIIGHGIENGDWICASYRGYPSLSLKLFGVASPILLASFIFFLPVTLSIFTALLLLRYFRRKVKLE